MQTAIIDPFKYGFIPEELTGEEEILGATEEDEILQPNRDWTPYLGVKEVQNLFHETWNCTVFAMWNGLECYGKRKFEVEINGSDRFSGKMGGTNPGYGNTFRNSFATLNRDGFLYEEEYPFDSKDVYEYYKTIDERLKAKALERTKRFEFKRKLVSGGALSPEQLWEALQYTPLRVSVSAWNYPVNGVYTRVNTIINHAVLLFKGEYGKFWWIYDSYDDDIKKLSWDFLFGSADAITFNYKFMGNVS